MAGEDLGGRLLGQVTWDGSAATSERVLLRASVADRRLVERNRYVRILDEDGMRSGFLGRVITGPFFHRCGTATVARSEEHTSELQSHVNLVCRLLLEKKKQNHK